MNKSVVYTGLLTVLGLSISSCAALGIGGHEDGTVRIGTPNPLTGTSAIYGMEAEQGASLAVEQINQRPGKCFNNEVAELVREDDKANPEASVTAVRKLMLREGVNGLVGGASSAAVTASVELTRDKIVQINTTAQSDTITEHGGSMLFQMNMTTSDYIKKFNDFIVHEIQPSSIVYMAEDSVYNAGVVELLEPGMAAAGIKLADVALYQSDTNDFTAMLHRMKATGADALVLADGSPSRMSTLMQQVRQIGGFDTVLVAPGVVSQNIIDATGEAMNGVLTGDVYSPGIDNEHNEQFVRAMNEKFPDAAITKVQELNYEGIYALCDAMTSANSKTDQEAIAEAMRRLSVETPRGLVTFGEKGRAQAPGFFIQEVRDGELHVIQTVK